MEKKRIYVASSWRNEEQAFVVAELRRAGHEVYDFKNPRPGDHGFSWSEISQQWKGWSPEAFRAGLKDPIAQAGFKSDFDAMVWANEFCLVLPCGRSAHLEAGWAAGANKRLSIYMPVQVEPELMYLTGGDRTRICITMEEALKFHEEI